MHETKILRMTLNKISMDGKYQAMLYDHKREKTIEINSMRFDDI